MLLRGNHSHLQLQHTLCNFLDRTEPSVDFKGLVTLVVSNLQRMPTIEDFQQPNSAFQNEIGNTKSKHFVQDGLCFLPSFLLSLFLCATLLLPPILDLLYTALDLLPNLLQ